ncbi:uncharacterized protein I206_103328 [Kwoniella pini CBS 10737]|uniref:Uncharacterized protein n=1 Tax=Kwoniella pini CBS 10737 TaxID=1296096 RepID=A0A1B9IA86_9TREE|nr:uncharacterized protein I206_01666 [Kwoniella pini CBS 10737]OCF52377.1 hypothetical protein I206_01666 [Kwoniella pini CBS 10737]
MLGNTNRRCDSFFDTDENDLTDSSFWMEEESEDLYKFASPPMDRWRYLLNLGETEVELGHSYLNLPTSIYSTMTANHPSTMEINNSALGLQGVPPPSSILSSTISSPNIDNHTSYTTEFSSIRKFNYLSLNNEDIGDEESKIIPIKATSPNSFELSPQEQFDLLSLNLMNISNNSNSNRQSINKKNLSLDSIEFNEDFEFGEISDSPELDLDLDLDLSDEILITPSEMNFLPLLIQRRNQELEAQPYMESQLHLNSITDFATYPSKIGCIGLGIDFGSTSSESNSIITPDDKSRFSSECIEDLVHSESQRSGIEQRGKSINWSSFSIQSLLSQDPDSNSTSTGKEEYEFENWFESIESSLLPSPFSYNSAMSTH